MGVPENGPGLYDRILEAVWVVGIVVDCAILCAVLPAGPVLVWICCHTGCRLHRVITGIGGDVLSENRFYIPVFFHVPLGSGNPV